MKIEFIKDYANKKKGETAEYDGMLSRTLINLGVAKEQGETKKVSKTKKSK